MMVLPLICGPYCVLGIRCPVRLVVNGRRNTLVNGGVSHGPLVVEWMICPSLMVILKCGRRVLPWLLLKLGGLSDGVYVPLIVRCRRNNLCRLSGGSLEFCTPW